MAGDSVGFMNVNGAQGVYDALFSGGGLNPLSYHLNTSDVPMTQTDANSSSYTEPADTGYSPILTTAIAVDLGHNDSFAFLQQFPTWEFTGDPGHETVFGMWVEGDSGEPGVLYAWNLPTPFPIVAGSFSSLELNPVVHLGTCSTVPVPPPPPPPILAPYAWYRADILTYSAGDTITTWPDSSANGFTIYGGGLVTYETNVVNGLPVARYASAGSLSRALTMGTAYTIFTVAHPVGAGGAGDGYVTGYDGSDNGIHYSNTACQMAEGNVFLSLTNPVGGFEQRSYCFNGASSFGRLNGFPDTSGTVGTASHTQIYVGDDGSGARGFDGDLAEIIFYNSALSLSDIENIEAYLLAKYDI